MGPQRNEWAKWSERFHLFGEVQLNFSLQSIKTNQPISLVCWLMKERREWSELPANEMEWIGGLWAALLCREWTPLHQSLIDFSSSFLPFLLSLREKTSGGCVLFLCGAGKFVNGVSEALSAAVQWRNESNEWSYWMERRERELKERNGAEGSWRNEMKTAASRMAQAKQINEWKWSDLWSWVWWPAGPRRKLNWFHQLKWKQTLSFNSNKTINQQLHSN